MGLGVLPASSSHVQGTVNVYEDERRRAHAVAHATHLKKDKSGRFILTPQPSDDPNDPLVSVICRTRFRLAHSL